jgi:hypothetical protein
MKAHHYLISRKETLTEFVSVTKHSKLDNMFRHFCTRGRAMSTALSSVQGIVVLVTIRSAAPQNLARSIISCTV